MMKYLLAATVAAFPLSAVADGVTLKLIDYYAAGHQVSVVWHESRCAASCEHGVLEVVKSYREIGNTTGTGRGVSVANIAYPLETRTAKELGDQLQAIAVTVADPDSSQRDIIDAVLNAL